MLKKLSFIFLSLIIITSCQTGSLRDSFDASYKYAQNTPYGRYPETVTYTLAHMAGVNNSYMPEGDTSENNAYTRYLSKKLNIQNINKIDEVEDRYFKAVNYSILKKNIPDVMIINNYHDLQYLVEHDMIEDLSTAYKKCTTQRIKDIYNSYPSILNHVTINGKLYAMPETNINDGPNLFWCREDWLKECGLQAPKTLTDVENIVRTFKKKKKTVGLVTDTSLTAGTGFSSEYLLNLYFASYNTYPKQWIMKGNQANYGSVDQNVKKVLSHLHELYKEGVLDQKFLERTSNNIAQLIIDGQCGAFFGPWWVPNNPLVTAKQKDASINWKPYRIETNKNG
ncbi:MAG TPA: peripheral protein, partial [Kandleria vitulina]|nr:peripheral protein [Kandleria vitulina]